MTRCRFSLSVITLCALAVLGGCNRDRARAGEADEGRVLAMDEMQSPSRAKSPAGKARGVARSVAKDGGAVTVAGAESAGSDEDTTSSFTISGRVTLRDGGAASGAVVRVSRFDFVERAPVITVVDSTTAGDDGRYRVRMETVGTYSVTAYRAGSVPAVMSATSFFGTDRSFRADFVLEPASRVRGRVVAEGDRPVAGARVRWVTHSDDPTAPLTDDSMATVTLNDGGFALESLPEGDLLLAVVSDHHVVTTQTVSAPAENVVIRLASEGGRIEGGVYDSGTREGIAGATVTLTLQGSYPGRMGIDPFTVVTDPVGAFSMERLPAGVWTIAAGKEKLGMVLPGSPGASAATLTLGDRESTGGLRLFLYAGHTIRVVSMGNNRSSVPQGEVRTGADGSFALNDLMPEQEIMILSTKAGYSDSPLERLVLKPGERRSEVKLVLRKSSFLAGTVTDEAGKPVEWVSIAVTGNEGGYSIPAVRTDNRGRYRVENLMEGSWAVTASHDDWKETKGAKTGREDVDFVVPPKAEKGVVIGRVIDAKTRAPVHDFTIASANDFTIETKGQEPGMFIGKGLNSGKRYRVTIVAEGYRDLTSEYFSLPEGMLTMEKIFEMGPGGNVAGRVVDAGTKAPLPGVRIVLKAGEERWRAATQNPAAMAVTDGEGRFRLESLEAGRSRVYFRPDKPLVQKDAAVTVTHGKEIDMGDVELGAGGTVRGRLIRMPGEIPIADSWIQLTETSSLLGKSPGMKSGSKGEFEFTGLPASNYYLNALDGKVSRYITLAEGATREVVLRLGGGVLKGSVLRGDKPVTMANVKLTLHGSTDDFRNAQSDAEGKFTLEGMLAGKWSVSVRRQIDGNDLSGLDEIEIAEGETQEKVFRMSYGLMRGRVTDADGKPVGGARIIFPVPGRAGVQSRSGSKESARDGGWSMNGMKPGRYTVVATKKGYAPSDPVTVEVPAEGESSDAVLVLRDVNDGGTLVSTTYRITDGGPLLGAWTKLRGADGSYLDHGTERDSEGVMKIEGIPPGTYNVEVSAWGYSVSNHPATVIEAGKTVRLEDVLHDCGSLDWVLVDKAGSALKDIPVRLVPDDAVSIETVREGRTDFAGMYSTRGIAPGRYTATATPPGKSPVTLAVTIVAHEGVEETTVVE